MKKISYTLIVFLTTMFSVSLNAQNVGVNSTGASPDASAMLDVVSTNKGVLIPRVALTATNSNSPIGSGITTSLLVYNTATASSGSTAVSPGYYYWNGTNWISFLNTANNPVSVSLSSDYTVTTTAYADVTGMSVTFTATKSTALVQFTSSGYGSINSMAYVGFRIYNTTTSTSLGGTMTTMQSYDQGRGTITPWSCSFSKTVTGLTPGNSYTFKIQGQRDGILGTYDAIINASSFPDEQHMTLTVFP